MADCRPRLFVYRLPEAYRSPRVKYGNLPPDGIGEPLSMRDQIDAPLWNTDQYSLGSLVHERALSYNCRTHDPSSADLFLVPAYRSYMGESGCAEPAGSHLRLLQRLQLPLRNAKEGRAQPSADGRAPTSLDARGGADHIFLNPRNGELWDRTASCELTFGSPQLGAALYFSMEAGNQHGETWVYPEGYCGTVCVPAYHPQLLSESWYWSLPWPSTVHLDVSATSAPWASTHKRSILVAAHFNTQHKPILPRPTLHLRLRLLASCRAQPSRCSAVPVNMNVTDKVQGGEETALLYWQSTFCLQPGGDTVSRKGIVDAILLGCVPVLFHTGQLAQWPWHWGEWVSSATVLLNESAVRAREIDVVDTLAAIPPARIEQLRASLRAHAHRMQYSAVDTSALPPRVREFAAPDAFDVLLQQSWRVSRDVPLQQLGRTLMRSRKGGHEVSKRRYALAMGLPPSNASAAVQGGVHEGGAGGGRMAPRAKPRGTTGKKGR
jgi:hypothetical protein